MKISKLKKATSGEGIMFAFHLGTCFTVESGQLYYMKMKQEGFFRI